jgi:hypothetical protein
MGHSSIATTSVYAHGSAKEISNLIDLSIDGEDFSSTVSITTKVKTEIKKHLKWQ